MPEVSYLILKQVKKLMSTVDRKRSRKQRGIKRNEPFESGTVTDETKKTTEQEREGETCKLLRLWKLTHYSLIFTKEVKTKLRIWMTKD